MEEAKVKRSESRTGFFRKTLEAKISRTRMTSIRR
jgi:hypothetical protein